MSSGEPAPALTTEVVSGPATRSDYAEAICQCYHETVDGIFRMGRLLIKAKEDIPFGEYGAMVEEDLPFGKRTARMLSAIARDERLQDRKRASALPAAWTTLYKLTRLNDAEWAAIEPHISPELKRSEIPDLVAKGAQLRLIPDDLRTAREEVEAAIKKLPRSERIWLKKHLRGPITEAIRVAQAFAEMPAEERARLIELSEVESPPAESDEATEDVQLALLGLADDKRAELTKWDVCRPFGDPRMEGARAVLTLQSLLRWAVALHDRTSLESIPSGRWVARNPQKIARDARQVAEWFSETAARLDRSGPRSQTPNREEQPDGQTCPTCSMRLSWGTEIRETHQIGPTAETCEGCRYHAREVGELWAAA